ncbi:MAG: hypothetical protein Q8P82_01810 [bacterium]|nr:hypothetical protein [bacterium]
MLEVFESLLKLEGVSLEEVVSIKERRHAERGGFDGRIYLIADAPVPVEKLTE